MFEVDPKGKRIHTMTKSGCCWHQVSEYIVENNNPKAISIVEDDQTTSPYETLPNRNGTVRKWSRVLKKCLTSKI